MLLRRIRSYVHYLIAAVIALNGFFALGRGLTQVFHFDLYVQVEPSDVGELIDVAPGLDASGFVSIFLGLLLLALGKGLAERRRRTWNLALGVLSLLLLNNVLLSLPLRHFLPPTLLLALLLGFRRDFKYHPDRHQWTYGELVAGLSVVFALGYGVVGSYLLRNEFNGIASWTDAAYFTFVTFSTVGYGDFTPQTPNARIFTITMILIGLSSFATALTVLLGPLIEERMKGVFSVMSKFQKTVDHVVICGFTNVSESIFDELRDHQVPFVVIEDRENIFMLLKSQGIDVLHGDPTEKAVLEQANLVQAAAVIAATDSDATNTLIALTAKELRDSSEQHDFRIIVRIEDEENIIKVRHIGADEVISPSTLGGRLMASKALEEAAE